MNGPVQWISATLLLFSFFSCSPSNNDNEVKVEDGTLLELSYAKAFEVIRRGDLYEISIKDPFSEELIQAFRFSVSGDVEFDVPEKIACLSTTHASMIAALGEVGKIKTMAYRDRVMDPLVMEQIESGNISSLAGEGEVDKEKLIAAQPDIFFIYPYEMEQALKYDELGIQYIQIAEYLEPHPLGRAEWIKLFGILLGKPDEANAFYDRIEQDYLEAKNTTLKKWEKPMVFTGSYYQGNWFAPSGESLVAQFLKDAGAAYVFAETKGAENIQLEMEKMIEKAHLADYWGKVIYSDSIPMRSQFVEEDERLGSFKAFQEGRLFVCNAMRTDYFGKGILEPHVILKDLIEIFHPGTISDHNAVYFKMLRDE